MFRARSSVCVLRSWTAYATRGPAPVLDPRPASSLRGGTYRLLIASGNALSEAQQHNLSDMRRQLLRGHLCDPVLACIHRRKILRSQDALKHVNNGFSGAER